MKNARALLLLLLAAPASFSQDEVKGEHFFNQVGVEIQLTGKDSLHVVVRAGSEDLQNTVEVFPYTDADKAPFRALEQGLETYFQDRVPVWVDGKRIYLKVLRWKPDGKGREDGLDSVSLYVKNLFITLGGKLPPARDHLDVSANLWLERPEAGKTSVEMAFFDGATLLRQIWTVRERKIRLSLRPDSLERMRANPVSVRP